MRREKQRITTDFTCGGRRLSLTSHRGKFPATGTMRGIAQGGNHRNREETASAQEDAAPRIF
jgi:hypothetical protein